MRTAFSLAVFLFLQVTCFATTWYVPDDFPGGIQAAIQDPSVVNGDTIIVRPGVYVENIDYLGKAVTVKSGKGPAVTVIDGNQADSVVAFENGEGFDSVLDGFTLTNGDASKGGGIRCYLGSTPTIENNIIRDNTAAVGGGGIYCSHSTPLIKSNIVTGNTAVSGGGISCWNSDAEIVNNMVYANSASAGGGMNLEVSSPVVINNTVTANHASQLGGGIRCIYCFSAITNTIIWGNDASTDDEIYLDQASVPEVTYCNVGGGWPGTANIDADPVFIEPGTGDFHLTYDSPCKDRGRYDAPHLPERDFEGDYRDPCGIPDIGADEFWSHLYFMGENVPGGTCSIRIAATPGFTVKLVKGSGLRLPPKETKYGDLYLLPPYRPFDLGEVPASGILIHNAKVPSSWIPGKTYYFQSLIKWFPPFEHEYLSNLMALTLE